jgi:hypothetical protein
MGLDANTVGALSTGFQTAGVVSSTVGSYRKSQADQQAYEYQSKIASNNAQIAEWQQHDALMRGQVAENNVRQKAAQLRGSQEALMASRGLDLGEGSPLNILTDTQFMGARDANAAHDNAAKEAWGAGVQAQTYRADAAALKSRADAESPLRSAMGTLLTGAGKVAASWYSRNKTSAAPYAATNEWDS